MAAEASNNEANRVAIISPRYCCTYPVNLAIMRKMITDGNFDVQDVNGTVIFTVDKILPTFVHQRKLILDPAGNTILTLRKKAVTAIDTWQVFRGESEELEDLIFTAKRHSLMDINTQLDMFLSNNKNEQICDFKIKGTFLEESCDIYAGDEDSAPIIAKMQKRPSAEILFFGKTNFMVRVNPNVDHAFIVALIVILDEMLVVSY